MKTIQKLLNHSQGIMMNKICLTSDVGLTIKNAIYVKPAAVVARMGTVPSLHSLERL